MIFNIVFFISVTSVLIQGTTLPIVAKWLRVSLPEKVKPIAPTEAFLAEKPMTAMLEIDINADSFVIGKKIVDLAFPNTAIIALIKRNDKYLTPSGSTIIEANDKLFVLSDNEKSPHKIEDFLNRNKAFYSPL